MVSAFAFEMHEMPFSFTIIKKNLTGGGRTAPTASQLRKDHMTPAEKTPPKPGHAHMGQTELGPAYTVAQAGALHHSLGRKRTTAQCFTVVRLIAISCD